MYNTANMKCVNVLGEALYSCNIAPCSQCSSKMERQRQMFGSWALRAVTFVLTLQRQLCQHAECLCVSVVSPLSPQTFSLRYTHLLTEEISFLAQCINPPFRTITKRAVLKAQGRWECSLSYLRYHTFTLMKLHSDAEQRWLMLL